MSSNSSFVDAAGTVNLTTTGTVNLELSTSDKVYSSGNTPKSLDKNSKNVWITTKEGLQLLGISKQAFCKNVRSGKYTVCQVSGRGGKQYRVLLSSLGPAAELKYWKTRLATPELSSHVMEAPTPAITARTLFGRAITTEEISALLALPDWKRSEVMRWIKIFDETEHLRGSEIIGYFREKGEQNPDAAYRTYRRRREAFLSDGLLGLAPRWGTRTSTISDEVLEVFARAFLTQEKRSARACRQFVLGWALEHGVDPATIPSHHQFLRRLRDVYPEQVIYYARHGEAAWNRRYGPYIERDLAQVRCNEVWVGDHSPFDVMVLYDGKPCRPYLSAWADFKSLRLMGWCIHIEHSSSSHVILALSRGIRRFGVPKQLYMDNGKDFRVRDLGGGRTEQVSLADEVFDTPQMTNLVTMLGMKRPRYCLPYRAQSKPIERVFRIFREYFDKWMPGYTGWNTLAKPDSLTKDIKAGRLIEFEQLVSLFADFVENIYDNMAFEGGLRAGKRPIDIWNEDAPERRLISEEAAAMLTLRCSRPVPVYRNCLHDPDYNRRYSAPWLIQYTGSDERFYLWRDPDFPAKAWAVSEKTGAFVGSLFCREAINPFCETPDDYAKLAEQQATNNSIRREVRALATVEKVDPHDAQRYLRGAMATENGPKPKERHDSETTIITEFDRMIAEEKRLAATGTDDATMLLPEEYREDPLTPKKKKKGPEIDIDSY